VLTVTTGNRQGLQTLAAASGLQVTDRGEAVEVSVRDAGIARHLLAEHGDDVLDFEFRHGRMDDVFLALTGREHVEEEN
jgi:multidrug/hemolysin transport system ATP-binding protein